MIHTSINQLRRQGGIALITAILIVALASITASAMTARQGVDIRRAQNLFDADQASLYLAGAEDWAQQMLERDYKDDPKLDTLDDDWATVLPPIGVEGGQIAGKIEDLQGRFNLNNLLKGNAEQPDQIEIFKRLLTVLELPPELSDAVVDWIDEKDEVSPNGAEDNAYLLAKPPYRAGNGKMGSPSELLLVQGFDREKYAKLAPFVYTANDKTAININTAPEEIIRSLAADIDPTAVTKVLEKRAEQPFKEVHDFTADEAFAGLKFPDSGLSVTSQYFLLTADAQIGRLIRRSKVIVKRQEGKTLTLVRTQGDL